MLGIFGFGEEKGQLIYSINGKKFAIPNWYKKEDLSIEEVLYNLGNDGLFSTANMIIKKLEKVIQNGANNK